MNEKSKPMLIALLVLVVVAVSAVFIHAKRAGGTDEQPVIVKPDNPGAAPRPSDSSPVTSSVN